MTNRKNLLYLSAINAIAFVIMIVINFLSETIPLGGLTNKQISDLYKSIFTPTSLTFSIWIVIYLMLLIYTFFQFSKKGEESLRLVGPLYAVSSVLNVMWIIAWHAELPLLSFFVIATLLVTLFIILKKVNENFELGKAIFGIYAGWITVATMGNIMCALSKDIKVFHGSLLEEMLTITFLVIATFVGVYMVGINRNYYFSLTIIWAISGILIRHFNEFDGEYVSVIVTGFLGIIVLLSSIIIRLTEKKNHIEVSYMP